MRPLCVVAIAIVLLSAPPVRAQSVVASDVADDATDANSQPKVGFTSHGEAYLTFVKPVQNVDQVFVASSADLHRWDVQQITHATVPSRYPTLAVGGDDTVHIAWTQYDQGIGRVYYARTEGGRWSLPVKVSPGEAYAGVPSLAVDSRGTIHLVWYGIRPEAPAVRTRHGSVYEILYTASHDGQWLPPVLISPGIPDAVNPSLGIDDLGRVHSAWYQFDLRAYQARHAMYISAWTPPHTISTGHDDAFAVSLATGKQGTVYVVWERRETAGGRIYFAEFQKQWSPQQQISSSTDDAFHPAVAVDDAGRIFVAWDANGQILVRRRGSDWESIERVPAEGKNAQPTLGASRGTVLLAWTQALAGTFRIQATTLEGKSLTPAPGGSPRPWSVLALAAILLSAALLWTRR
ncbi:MAG TPA: hypothetical protein VNA31_11120, partial [bacterium]|nr:hypothetical protein [bacterium]